MEQKLKTAVPQLLIEAGQIWQVPGSQITIVRLGKTLAHYKRSDGRKKHGISVQIESIRAMRQFLTKSEAKLLPTTVKVAAAA